MASVEAVHSEVTVHPNVFRRVMAKHPELILIVVGLALTIISRYGSSLKPKPITVPPKPPKRFFPESSPVYDYFNGELEPVVRLLGTEELIFLMYYAPWCSRSMAARSEFHKAAKHMLGQVKFVAVNCWWPDGHCRKRYKFLMFPILFVYHTHLDGFRYIGYMSAEHMVKFVEEMIYPITSLHSHDQVKDFITKHDGGVVGYFDLNSSPQPPGYQQFYYAAMRTLEQDPYNHIRFAVVTDTGIAELFNLTQPKEIALLRLTNTTVKFPEDYNFTSSQIVSWVLTYRQKPLVQLLAPLGVKSLILSREMEQGPAVIAFYALNPLLDTNRPYHVMKQLALQYHSCEENTNLIGAVSRWRQHISSANIQYHELVEFCTKYQKQRNSGLYNFKCCVSIATKILEESPNQARNICEYCVHTQSERKIDCMQLEVHPRILKWTNLQTNHCRDSVVNYNANEYHSMCCEHCESTQVPLTPFDHLPMSFKSGKRRLTDRYVLQQTDIRPKRMCQKLTLQKIQGHVPYENSFGVENPLPSNFTGLGCRSNRTVNFYAMDAVRHSVFAERLGVDVSSLPHNPAVVIFDKESEEQYLLKDNFSAVNVATFILNFTAGHNPRSLRSLSEPGLNCDNTDKSACTVEVTTHTFQANVIQQQKDVLLLVYSKWCGFCANINHVYLSLVKYFHAADSIVFARINGDTNDLPWEFTVDSYPQLIFFPAHRKSDSVVFPDSMAVTLHNLVRFVLQHSTQNLRVETALGVCSKSCISRNRQYALAASRRLHLRQTRLKVRLSAVTTRHEHQSDVGRMFSELSQNYIRQALKGVRRSLDTVENLLEFLQNSNGVYIEHSRLISFMREHRLLHESKL